MNRITFFSTLKAEKNVMRFINQCFDIIAKMSGNESFKKPPVAYDEVIAAIKELRNAEDEARMRTAGAVPIRDNERENVMKFMHRLHLFVQELADDAENEKKANAI